MIGRCADLLDAKNNSYATTDEGVLSRPFSPRNNSPASFVRVNGKIRAREVRVIGVDDSQLGVIPLTEALNLARQHGVDLVEIAATATPPVCRLVDFGKFRYEQAKKEKESKKHQHASTVKEVQLSPRIDPHDLGIKLTHAIDFLCEDMKVKIALKFRGREMAHTEVGFQVINKFLADIAPYGHPDFQPKLIGRGINVMISPLPRNKRAKNPHAAEVQNHQPVEKNHHESSSAPPQKVKVPVASAPQISGLNSPFANLEVKQPA
ncbi:MAG TPA: translation initiation factor IF-3 [Verrucomicrobiae bacterium]